MTVPLFLFFCLLIVTALIVRHLLMWRKRKQLLATPLTAQQREIVLELVPIVRRVPASLGPGFEGKINLFLNQITFHGNDGLEVTERMKLSIAAQACLLIMNSPAWYESLRTILIYPSAFLANRNTHDGYVVHESNVGSLGESWDRGPVVLSWDHALQGGLNAEDGHNVVIHEFAHQLDSLTGRTNGVPILRKGQAFARWEKAMLSAYDHHVKSVESGQATLLDAYGAKNHQEFFAEAIVTFFEKPEHLRREEPALYLQLAKLLGLDPAEWDATKV